MAGSIGGAIEGVLWFGGDADAFRAEGLLPRPVDTAALGIWAPTARRAAQ